MMDATTILEHLKSGVTNANAQVEEAIAKIEATHPKLNAAMEILKSEAAQQLEQLPDGPLKGLPISVKECYAMAGKSITSGSKRMKLLICKEDATVVKRLKDAGAIIVARGNTSEFLLGRETNNLLNGTTNSIFNPELTSGGSSGGDGALVGSDCVALGIGTDIGGSCRYPAVFNGIVGFKPASGLIDKKGIFPSAGNTFTESMNSPGILSRSVRDARMVYNVIAGKNINAAPDMSHIQIYTSANFKVAIEDDSIQKALDASLTFFSTKSLPVKNLDIPESGKLYGLFVSLICAGFTDKIYEWSRTEDGSELTFMGEFFRRMMGRPTLSDELFSMLIPFNIFRPSASKLKKVIETATMLREKYHTLFGKNGILVLPTVGVLAPPHKKFIKQYNKPGVIEIITPVSFCNVLNLSCITIPAWKFQTNNEINPPAIQLVAAAGNEELLLRTAEELEAYLK